MRKMMTGDYAYTLTPFIRYLIKLIHNGNK